MTTKTILSDKVQTTLLSVVAASLIGCLTFLWNVNASLARLQEHDTDTIKSREEQSTKMNNVQLDIRDIRERLIRIESKQRQ